MACRSDWNSVTIVAEGHHSILEETHVVLNFLVEFLRSFHLANVNLRQLHTTFNLDGVVAERYANMKTY